MMRLIYIISFLMLGFTGLSAQNLELTVRYNFTEARYEVYALPDASNPSFFWGPSQITVVVPASVPDAPFTVTSVQAGAWLDNTQATAPAVTPDLDYHAVGSLGAAVAFTAGEEALIFHFVIPGEGCVDGIRLFENDTDPDSSADGMQGGDFRNTVFSLTGEAYVGNYDNDGTACTPLDTDGDGYSDEEELTGVDDPLTDAVPMGMSDPDDPCDPDPFALDTNDCDEDGLTNEEEVIAGTDPANPDSDGDGLNDGEEVTGVDDPNTPAVADAPSDANDPCDPDPLALDTNDCDEDGLTNEEEAIAGTDPANPDSDGDGFNDGEEVTGVDDPNTPAMADGMSDPSDPCDPDPLALDTNDCDEDGLTNEEEAIAGTDPANPDSDGDGFNDGEEVTGVDDPNTPAMADGTSDANDPCDPDPLALDTNDCDEDGLTNEEEAIAGTDPANPDSDGDGFNDGEEVTGVDDPNTPAMADGTSDPSDACDPDPLALDTNDCDEDGLTNEEEAIAGTDPENPDSDGDGFNDGEEVTGVDDPNTPAMADGMSDPSDPCDPDPLALDTNDCDEDGLTNEEEAIAGTDPANPDSDGDGFNDGEEVTGVDDPNTPAIADGTSDPNDSCDPDPLALPSNDCEVECDEVANLACRGAINLTLNDECQGIVIPQMVLSGDFGCLEPSDFDIVVQDADPSNGPIIDGCGEFIYTINKRTPEVVEPISGFTGPLAGDNWDTNADDAADWSATFTSSTLTLVTGPGGTGGRLMASYMFSDPGSLSFDYTYNNVDIGTNVQFDEAIVIVNFEGETVEVIENGAAEPTEQPLTGSPTVDIQPGYSIVFGIDEDGFDPLGDAADLANELIVSNLSFTFAGSESPVASEFEFEGCWGTVTAEDKTPPAIDTEIGDIELLCVDLDENRVDVLPNTVDRCYEVFSATGATVPNTMATALRNALSANTIGNGPAVVPTFTDGCTERLEVCVSETVTFDAEDPQCNDVVITRTFTATEIAVCPSASGETNASTVASYVITFTRPSLDDLDGDNIEATAVYDRCTVNTGTSTTADIIADYPAPRSADFPFLVTEGGRRVDLVNGESVCGFSVSFSDGNPTITCEYGYKFVRTYTVLDWCAPGDIRTFTQVVKVGDTEAPTFTGPTQDRDFDGVVDGDLIYTTNAGNSCAAYIILDGPGVGAVDNCSDEVTITATIFPGADLGATAIGAFVVDPTDGNAEVTSAIPVGTHLMRYTYTDDCGNTDFSDFIFTVEDGTAPVAICEDQLNVSISSGQASGSSEPTGIAILTPEMIDAGSYDDCTGVTLLIALEGTDLDDYSEELILTCADLGTIQVSLRVEDENGNVNTCWLDVLVEDKNIPTCIPPGPMTITCIEYNESLPADISEATEEQLNAAFGSAVGIDNCEVMISSSVSGSVNSCGVGQLIRSFEAEDGEGFTDNDACMQSITIRGIFDYTITFPTDEESGCADIPAFDGLATEEFACDLITTDITIDTIAAVNAPEACFTLRVNYDVINYCEYNQLGECYRIPRDGDGIRNPETQLLYLNVIPNSTVNTEDDIAFLSRFTDRNYNAGAPQRDQLVDDGDDNDGTDDDNGNASEDSQAANGIGFAYAQDDSRGFFCYIQYVDVYDEDAPTIEGDTPEECFAGSSADCTAEVTLTFTADDECTMPVVTGELDANYIASAGFIPTRNLTSEEVSNDGVNYTVNLSDIPVGNHAIRIRANDGCGNFDVEVIEFCVEGDKAPTPICIQTLTVTLMPDGNGGGMAEIWASDFIASDVEDCFGNVIDKYSIYTEEEAGAAGFEPQAGDQGVFFDCDDLDAENVPVRVYAIADNGTADYCSVVVNVQAFQEGLCESEGGNLAGTILTQHEEAVEGVEVTLTGDNDMDMMATTAGNGSYTFTNVPAGADYTVQPNHPVAVNLFTVTVGDVNLMGSVILGITDFATPYDYLAADVDHDQILTVGDMVSTQRVILGLDESFVDNENWGFVPADVDVTNPYAEAFPEVYNVNDLAGNLFNADFVALELGNVNAANRSSASIEVENAVLEAGQSHVIVLSGAELIGFQGTLELAAGLEIVDVTYEGEGGLNLNGAADGVITMMFLANATVNVEVRATEAGLLSELVALTSDVTVAEGVNLNGTAGPLSLNFTAATSTELVNNLEQNTPNPVADVTKIGFTLATAGEVTLTIQDIAGRTMSVRELSGVAGRNVVEFNVSELGGATGVLSYTLVSGDFSATKKMVVVR